MNKIIKKIEANNVLKKSEEKYLKQFKGNN